MTVLAVAALNIAALAWLYRLSEQQTARIRKDIDVAEHDIVLLECREMEVKDMMLHFNSVHQFENRPPEFKAEACDRILYDR